jgi:O-antigen/teichoic acid export membrane protein
MWPFSRPDGSVATVLTSTVGRVSLKQRVLGAGSWSIAGYAANQALRFGSNLLMTRLLAPDAFGVMALAYVILGSLAMLSDWGVKPIIIRSERGGDPAFLNTAWTIRTLQGALLWLMAVIIAIVVGIGDHFSLISKHSVYADPRVPYVIAAVSFAALIKGFGSTKIHESMRNLALGQLTVIDISAQIGGLMVMLAWVAIDRSIWALVAGGLFGAALRTILSHAYLQGTRNYWHWDRSAVHEIAHFGKWILVASILGLLANNGDRLILGGLVDPTILGIYAIAFFIFKSVDEMTASVIMNVTLPALSEIMRENPKALKATYYRLHAVISSFAYFCAGTLMISGQSLISLFYDSRYYQAGWMLQILAAALLATPFGVAERCFVAIGLPKYISQISTVSLVVLVVGIIGGFHLLGLRGAVFGIALSFLSSVPLVVFYQIKHGIFDLRKECFALLSVPAGMAAGLLLNGIINHL